MSKPRAKELASARLAQRRQEPEEKQTIEESNKRHSNVVKIQQCITFILYGKSRYFCIVPVPNQGDYYISSKTNQWYQGLGHFTQKVISKNCPFFFSTGTSNEGANFPDMWFPFYRLQTVEIVKPHITKPVGYIKKAYGLGHNKPLDNAVLKALKRIGTDINESDAKLLNSFLEKFSYWWQVQISASLPQGDKSLFLTNGFFIRLKSILLSYNEDVKNLIPNVKNIIITKYDLDPKKACKMKIEDPKEVNDWLRSNNALVMNEDDK